MKKSGIITFAVEILLILVTGFDFVTNEKVVELGDIEITADKSQYLDWLPLTGFAVMMIGGIVLLFVVK